MLDAITEVALEATSPLLPDPVAVASWPAAVVSVAMIVAVLVLPVLAGVTARHTRQTRDTAEATAVSLTTKNGGFTVLDKLDALAEDVSATRTELASTRADVNVLMAAHLAAAKIAVTQDGPAPSPPTGETADPS